MITVAGDIIPDVDFDKFKVTEVTVKTVKEERCKMLVKWEQQHEKGDRDYTIEKSSTVLDWLDCKAFEIIDELAPYLPSVNHQDDDCKPTIKAVKLWHENGDCNAVQFKYQFTAFGEKPSNADTGKMTFYAFGDESEPIVRKLILQLQLGISMWMVKL